MVGLHVRRAVTEFIDQPNVYYEPADVVVSLTGETWSKLFLS